MIYTDNQRLPEIDGDRHRQAETERQRQTNSDRDRQRQKETDKLRQRQTDTDTDTDGQRQTESIRDKNRLIQIRKGRTDTDTDRRKLTVTKRAKDVMSNRTKILAPFFFSFNPTTTNCVSMVFGCGRFRKKNGAAFSTFGHYMGSTF